MRSTFLAAILICFAFTTASRAADDKSAIINAALDKIVNLDINGVMPEAMKKITAETTVPIQVPQHVYDLLPWGEQTKITATIKNQTVRQSLTAITRRLGLKWTLESQAATLAPRFSLERVGRRATVAELETLALLDATPLDQSPAAGKPATVASIIKAVDQKLAEMKSTVTIEYRPGDKVKPDETVNLARNGTLNDALKELSKQTDLTWYPWGEHIIVLAKEDQIVRQLDRTITRHFVAADVAQVLTELSKAAGVNFDMEAGALQRVPADFRRITVTLENARVREALDDIRGVTGLDYVVKPTAVYLWNQNPLATATAAAPSPVMASLQLENGMILFLRANEIPADILDYIEHKRQVEFKRLRQQMKDEQFVPTTQPTE